LPAWVRSISPQKTALPGSQIRVIFRDDLISPENLETPERQSILSHLRIEPALSGRFSMSTPRMIAFDADAPLQPATRVRVTLLRGLADLDGHTLDHDYAWTFQTDPLFLTTNLPDAQHAQTVLPTTLTPEIVVSSNAELDTTALLAHARLVDTANPGTVVHFRDKSPRRRPEENQTRGYSYTLIPERELDRECRYHFEIEPGVLPAHGNLPSEARLVGVLETFGPLRLQGVTAYGKPAKDGTPGRFVSGAPQLLFTNGLVAQSAEKAISIQPEPANGEPLVQIKDGDASVILNPHAFLPNGHYVITIAPDLKDVFGQTLGTTVRQSFDTSNLAGDLRATSGFTLFPPDGDPALTVVATNLLEGEYRAGFHAVKPEDLIFADPAADAGVEKLLPPQSGWATIGAASGTNQPDAQRIPIRKHLGGSTGLLAYGITAKTNDVIADSGGTDVARASFMGAAELTNIGVFAQWFPDSGLVRTQHLSDGTPIAGVRITIYPSYANSKERGSAQSCANGTTDANGLLELRGSAFVRCANASKPSDRASNLLVIASTNGDWAFVRTGDRSGIYGYGVQMGWSAGVPQAHGAIVTDRGFYRPGETAYLAGIAYFDFNGVLGKGRASSYRLTLEGPDGARRDLGSASLDSFGAFSRAIPLEKNLASGNYVVHARSADGEALYGSLRVGQTEGGRPPGVVPTEASSAGADSGLSSADALPVKLDKATYRPGESAHVVVQSPYPQAELLLAVVRHGVLLKKTLLATGFTPQVAFTVTPDMAPNAAVEAVLVRRGPPPSQRDVPHVSAGLAHIGFASFTVALDAKYLKVTLTPEHDRIEPRGEQSVRVHVTDGTGRGVRAEAVTAAVNDAVLQLNGYRFPDLTKIVYAEQPISTRFADNHDATPRASPPQPTEKAFAQAGGFQAAAGSSLSAQVEPIAFYDATVKTDASGNATVHFRVPDELAAWRVLTTAFTQDARFGNAETAFLSTKPLAANAVLPRFARPGDTFLGGVSATNTRKIAGKVGISGVLGGDLAFVDRDNRTLSTTTIFTAPMEQLTQAFLFPMLATGNKTGNVQFTTVLGDERDAFAQTLPMQTDDVTESTTETGTTNEKAVIPLTIDPRTPNDIGGLDVTLASTLLPDAQEVVRAITANEMPFARDIASRVSVLSDAILLDRRYKQNADIPALQAVLAENLDALRALQREDGAYALWPGASVSDLSTTAFCAVSLTRARAAGANADADIARARSFLLSRLDDPLREGVGNQEPRKSEIRLEALATLGILGDVREDHLAQIYAQRKMFSLYDQVELARHLLKVPAWHARGTSLRDELFEAMGNAGETRKAEQAQAASLLIDSHARGQDLDRAFRTLLDQRTNGVWASPSDDAQAMDAMVAYAALQPVPPTFSANAQVPGRVVHAGFHGYENVILSVHIPLAKLPRGNWAVTMSKTGAGALHYVVAYRHGVLGELPGTYGGIRLERIVRSAGDEKELARFGLAQPAGSLTLDAGRVFEIEDRITTDHPIDQLVLNDPLPAGFEAANASGEIPMSAFEPGVDLGHIDYRRMYRDRVIAYAAHLEAGTYAVRYLVRSVTPGTFAWPGAQVHPEHASEDFGRSAAGKVVIKPS